MSSEAFPRYLSSPYQILFWESDEVAIMAAGYAISSTFGKFFELSIYALITWMLLIGPYVVYKYYKKQYPSGFFKHLLYFMGFKNVPYCPEYFIDQFME